jgi:SnoaL-like domain
MKNSISIYFTFFILFSISLNSSTAQSSSEKIKSEITETLNLWNTVGKINNVDEVMSQFDSSENIILVGSDSGEIFRGKTQIKGWLVQLLKHAGFSWEMNKIDIDYNDNSAWVFVEGKMVVKWDSGETHKTPYRFTGIMVKRNGVWKWRLFDGSIPRGE